MKSIFICDFIIPVYVNCWPFCIFPFSPHLSLSLPAPFWEPSLLFWFCFWILILYLNISFIVLSLPVFILYSLGFFLIFLSLWTELMAYIFPVFLHSNNLKLFTSYCVQSTMYMYNIPSFTYRTLVFSWELLHLMLFSLWNVLLCLTHCVGLKFSIKNFECLEINIPESVNINIYS